MRHFKQATFWASFIAVGCVAALAAGQAPERPEFGSAAASAHGGDAVPDLQALPGDRLPPLNMLDQNGRLKPPPAGAPGGAYDLTKAHSTVPAPSLEIAIAGARAALADCAARGRRGGVTVVDSAGEVRVSMSADGEDGTHVFVAQRKTLTALGFKMPSADAQAAIAKEPALLSRVIPAMFVQFGAIPITSRGQIIGAIGYSGGDDVNCATAGWKVIQSRLPQ
jgi:uncharacterized protein GlcG (DUF336 family)